MYVFIIDVYIMKYIKNYQDLGDNIGTNIYGNSLLSLVSDIFIKMIPKCEACKWKVMFSNKYSLVILADL